jgi:hypothetical protein
MFVNVIKLEAEVNELKSEIEHVDIIEEPVFLFVSTLMTVISKTQNPKAVKKQQ